MKLIKPSQISGEIMTLIEEADKKLVLVSPYCSFSKWNKFLKAISFVKRKKIPVEFYVRYGEPKSTAEVASIGFKPIEISNLHTKLYFNETMAIISSMNLVEYSDSNSLDIAYKTETEEELNELMEYYRRYLLIGKDSKPMAGPMLSSGNWQIALEKKLRKKTKEKFEVFFDGKELKCQGPNNYSAFIQKRGDQNFIMIFGVLTIPETDALEYKEYNSQNIFSLDTVLCKADDFCQYNTIRHYSNLPLTSKKFEKLNSRELDILSDLMANFVAVVQRHKTYRLGW
jgi:hypothetical protein